MIKEKFPGILNVTNKIPDKSRIIFLWVFLICNIFLSSYFLDTWNTPNAVSRALPVLTFWEEGTLKINSYQQYTGDKSKVGNDYYSDKAPLPTLLMIPVYGLIHKLNIQKKGESFLYDKHPVYIWNAVNVKDGRSFQLDKFFLILLTASILFGAIPFALMVWLTMRYTKKTDSGGLMVLIVMLGWYGSFIFVFAGTFFSHVFTGFLLLLSYIFLRYKKQFLISGLFAGLAFLSEYPVGLVIILWPIIIFLNEKKVIKPLLFLLGSLPCIAAIIAYNYYITGSPLKMLNAYHAFEQFGGQLKHNYGFGLSNFSFESVWGLSFSAYMGMLFYIPVLYIFIFFLIRDFFKKNLKWTDIYKSYLGTFAVAYFFLFTAFFTWWGGWSFGPRYLIPLGCLLVFEGIRYISIQKIHPLIYIVFSGFGLITAWLAKSTLMYMIPDRSGPEGPKPAMGSNPISDWLIPEFNAGRFNGNSLFSSVISPQLSAILWLLCFILITCLLIYYQSMIYKSVLLKAGNKSFTAKKINSKNSILNRH